MEEDTTVAGSGFNIHMRRDASTYVHTHARTHMHASHISTNDSCYLSTCLLGQLPGGQVAGTAKLTSLLRL